MDGLTCRIKEYIQPFERRLALEELRALAGSPVIPVDGDDATASTFSVARSGDAGILRDALAYWHSVGDRMDGMTTQLRREATVEFARNGATGDGLAEIMRARLLARLPNKRCLRYATHGLHEYRGKFFPQLVRALMNIVKLPKGGVVLDPMCGSGTTLVEARLSGRTAYGLDMNPLSVFITDVKCRALTLDPGALTGACDTLRRELAAPSTQCGGTGRLAGLAKRDREYLERWFTGRTLRELDRIDAAVRRLPTATLRSFYLVCLSNILRGVSQQKNDDLRVRREETELDAGETIARFLDQAARSTRTVAAFLAERASARAGRHAVREADARQAADALPSLAGKVDAVITSPPYATALPYLDTDRLSLVYLGLLPRDNHRTRDTTMIGNREVTTGARTEYWRFFAANKSLLPRSVRGVIQRIDRLNTGGDTGFRRRNLPALLSKYFFDMREVMRQTFSLLRPGGTLFLVIGNNRTTAGGRPVEIRTADYLGEIAGDIGFQPAGDVAMDMLVSRDIFRKNAVPSERIVRLDKPQ